MSTDPTKSCGRVRGSYKKFSARDKYRIGHYASIHGTSAALRKFKIEFNGNLKWSTVNDWKKEIQKRNLKKSHNEPPMTELCGKKRGRPSILPEECEKELKAYITELRVAGGVINSHIVIGAGYGIMQKRNSSMLLCNGGTVELKKSWANYFLHRMNFVKRKGTTKGKLTVADFEEKKQQFLLDVKAVVELEEIPGALVINWDQTGLNYVPVSNWTMAREGSKRIEITGLNDKRQITAVFGGSLSGDFLPVQLVYQGKTQKCLPTVSFPDSWDVTMTPNHWSN